MSLLIVSCGSERNEEIEFLIANASEPSSLDPHKISGTVERRINFALFETLVRPDPKTSEPIPGVAESWSNEGSIYTMKIRKEAVWSDGVPITADTVKQSWIRVLNPETASPYAWFPAIFIKGASAYNQGEADQDSIAIKVIDDYTFQFETVGDLPYTLGALSHYSFAIVPIHAIEKYGADWILPENWVGNGPYVLDKWAPQEILEVVKNETFWDKDNVHIDRIVFFPSDDNNTTFNMYENGEVDWTVTIPGGKYEHIKGRSDVQVAPILGTYYYVFNQARAPLNDPRIRKALSYTLIRSDITQQITKEGQVAAYGMVPEMAGYTPPDFYKEDIEKAKALLAEAGYPDGKGFPTLTLLYNTSESHKQIAEYVQQQWKTSLNIDIKVENQEWKTYLSTRREGKFDIARAGWIGDYRDPNTFLDMFVTGGDLNDASYSSDTYDTLIHEAARAQGDIRMQKLQQAEDMLINQDMVIIPIYFYVSKHLIDTDKWEGWYPNIMDEHPYIGMKKVSD